jgi:hypothetical protein
LFSRLFCVVESQSHFLQEASVFKKRRAAFLA